MREGRHVLDPSNLLGGAFEVWFREEVLPLADTRKRIVV